MVLSRRVKLQLFLAFLAAWAGYAAEVKTTNWVPDRISALMIQAAEGNPDAQNKIASAYEHGSGLEKDQARALRWYKRAANQGNGEAMMALAGCYQHGVGTETNLIESYKWYKLSTDKGETYSIVAYFMVERLAKKMTRGQVTEAKRRADAFKAVPEMPVAAPEPEKPKPKGEIEACGSGFFITDDGVILTSYHVIKDAVSLWVWTNNCVMEADLVGLDKVNDLALLKVDTKSAGLPLTNSGGVALGRSVFTIGFPNTGIQGVSPKLTKGEISSLAGLNDDPRYFQISVAVQPGNSGGPLCDEYGNVVGVIDSTLQDVTARGIATMPQNVNYARKSALALVMIDARPAIASRLKPPSKSRPESFEATAKNVESATVLILQGK